MLFDSSETRGVNNLYSNCFCVVRLYGRKNQKAHRVRGIKESKNWRMRRLSYSTNKLYSDLTAARGLGTILKSVAIVEEDKQHMDMFVWMLAWSKHKLQSGKSCLRVSEELSTVAVKSRPKRPSGRCNVSTNDWIATLTMWHL